jgi:hypothetical protein
MPENPRQPAESHEVTRRRVELRADCSRCAALCCVVPAFAVSADFAINKPARQPCPNLTASFQCSIHDRLRPAGFSGCAAFDCFGAGQAVVQKTFGGRDWKSDPDVAEPMFAAFPVMRQLHQLMFYLNEALALTPADPLPARLGEFLAATADMARSQPEDLASLDVAGHRERANAVLAAVSEQARASAGRTGPDLRGADLAGKDLRRTDLAGANLRGALLIAAILTGSDLSYTDVTGADLRGARLAGAKLAQTLFLSQEQLDSARGDAQTTLPDRLTRPAHWK